MVNLQKYVFYRLIRNIFFILQAHHFREQDIDGKLGLYLCRYLALVFNFFKCYFWILKVLCHAMVVVYSLFTPLKTFSKTLKTQVL